LKPGFFVILSTAKDLIPLKMRDPPPPVAAQNDKNGLKSDFDKIAS
jgi:hypothetical protein